MINRSLVWIPFVILSACGGTPAPAMAPGPIEQSGAPAGNPVGSSAASAPAPAAAPQGPAATPARSAAEKAADEKRAQAAAEAIEVLAKDPSMDAATLPRSAAAELSEAEYGLPEQTRKALAAVVSGRMDPSQRLTILRQLIATEPLSSVLQGLCGKPVETVLADTSAGAPEARTGSVLARCNQKPSEVLGSLEPAKVEPVAALLSAALLKVIERRGGVTEPEKKLVRMLAGFSAHQ